MGLPLASRAVTVIVELPLPAAIGDVALTVDCAAETLPTLTTTVAVWVIATVLIVAKTVFEPAAVELNVPVICPLASVVPTRFVSVFPGVGVAGRVTVAPLISSLRSARGRSPRFFFFTDPPTPDLYPLPLPDALPPRPPPRSATSRSVSTAPRTPSPQSRRPSPSG